MAMTVSEMADRAAKRGADRTTFIERVRHWTRERLLKPLGQRHPGRGRHRAYSDSALEDALLLNAMTNLGIQIEIQRTALLLAHDAKKDWREKAKQGVDVFLEIDVMPDGQIFPHSHNRNWINPAAEYAIIFNLTRVFAPLVP
jgi:DNA-binding transcriptional MerR regulator